MSQPGSLVVLCNMQGQVTKVLNDSLGLGAAIQPGMPFPRLAARGALAKALSFLTEINAHGAAFDWEINILLKNEIKTLHFTGSKVNDAVLIVAAENGKIARTLFEGMMQMNNEQTNHLRAALKENSRPERDDSQFNEISRLNNELVSMQRELAKKNAELERLNQEKNRFLGMAAHDLRNPLQSILAHSAFLLDEDPVALGADYHKFMEVIFASTEFMARLVDDLLDVVKIESGRLQLDYSAVDLVALVTRNVVLNRVLAAKKQVEIELITETLPTAMLDSVKIEQVLNNLLGNAVKFSEPGSKVTVCLVGQIENFVMSIKDEGAGMSPDEQSQLFKPFQPGSAGTWGEKSTGLGLMIVKRVVEGHAGKIWLKSSPGRGTTFFISIPLQPKGQEK
ncbi:MAG: two-component hybrid sensor and regulator [Chloroflexi bacterium HGW-Chloroflexi-6]|nr:MAG: two-component hybrid sensor and regulator [Chloroflexi bacterium HGW-Chloroflexi-6]